MSQAEAYGADSVGDNYHEEKLAAWKSIWYGIAPGTAMSFANFEPSGSDGKPAIVIAKVEGMVPIVVPGCSHAGAVTTQQVFDYLATTVAPKAKFARYLSGEPSDTLPIDDFILSDDRDVYASQIYDPKLGAMGYLVYAKDDSEPNPNMNGPSPRYFRDPWGLGIPGTKIPTMTVMERLLFEIYRRTFWDEYTPDQTVETAYLPDLDSLTVCPGTHLKNDEWVPSMSHDADGTVAVNCVSTWFEGREGAGARVVVPVFGRRRDGLEALARMWEQVWIGLGVGAVSGAAAPDFSRLSITPVSGMLPVVMWCKAGLTVGAIVSSYAAQFGARVLLADRYAQSEGGVAVRAAGEQDPLATVLDTVTVGEDRTCDRATDEGFYVIWVREPDSGRASLEYPGFSAMHVQRATQGSSGLTLSERVAVEAFCRLYRGATLDAVDSKTLCIGTTTDISLVGPVDSRERGLGAVAPRLSTPVAYTDPESGDFCIDFVDREFGGLTSVGSRLVQRVSQASILRPKAGLL